MVPSPMTLREVAERLIHEFGAGNAVREQHEWLLDGGAQGAACMLTLRILELAHQPEVVITSAGLSGHLTQISIPISAPKHLEALIASVRQWTGIPGVPGSRAPPPPATPADPARHPGRNAEAAVREAAPSPGVRTGDAERPGGGAGASRPPPHLHHGPC